MTTIKMIILGQTGVGKSVVCNRLCGDISLKCDRKNKYPIHHGSQPIKGNCQIGGIEIENKYTIYVIDTPGIYSDDQNNINKIIKDAINVADSIHGYIIVINGSNPRFDDHQLNMLRQFTKEFGKDFWKSVVIVVSKIDINNYNGEENFQTIKQTLSQIRDKHQLHDYNNLNIPIFPIGYGYDSSYYNKFASQIIDTISKFESHHSFDELVQFLS